MALDTVRVVDTDFDLLTKLKRTTGIRNWNVLCRWAFCMSLADPSPPVVDPIGSLSSIEMTWKVFSGTHSSVYWSLLTQRCQDDGISLDADRLEGEFYRHLHRGIGLLSNIAQRPSLRDLFDLAS